MIGALWSVMILLSGAVVVTVLKARRSAALRRWLAGTISQVGEYLPDPVSIVDEYGLGGATEAVFPLPLRELVPQPPFAAFVLHPSCGTCKRIWSQVLESDSYNDLNLIYEAGREQTLRNANLFRVPAIECPAPIMAELPSGLVLLVREDWVISEMLVAESFDDVARVLARR